MKVLFVVACLVCATVAAPRKQVDLSDDKVLKVAKFATQELVKYYRNDYLFKLYKLVYAQHDEERNRYDLEIIIGDTTCETSETDPADIDDCEFQSAPATYKVCQVILLPDGIINEYKLFSARCFLWIKPTDKPTVV
ncbi:uncharacterized protein LOC129221644 [Uloborus diversus]|uniref:uncharacterized protein LOC129221644 n=1 Tax=Uloborus diversus TaxID=327109 RepID=UPI00240933BA|nr:uncharacterized protein LOC129221644 [Uloborus diversus]